MCTHFDRVTPPLLIISSGDNFLHATKLLRRSFHLLFFNPGLAPGATVISPILGSLRLFLSSNESRRGDIMVDLKTIQRKNPEGMVLSFANYPCFSAAATYLLPLTRQLAGHKHYESQDAKPSKVCRYGRRKHPTLRVAHIRL